MAITNNVAAFVAIAVLSQALSGCAALGDSTVTAPPQTEFRSELRVARLELPEVAGKDVLAFSIEESPYAAVRIKDTRATPGQQEYSDGARNHHTVIAADIGLTNWLSGGLRAQPSSLMLKPGIRIQLTGAPSAKADVGNTSLSIGVSHLFSESHHSEGIGNLECVLLLFCSGNRLKLLDIEQRLSGTDIDLIAGYRFHQRGLLYAGGFYQNLVHRNRVTYTDRDASTREVVSSTVSKARSSVEVRGPVAGFAVNLTPRLLLVGEYLRYRLHWHQPALINEEESWGIALRTHL